MTRRINPTPSWEHAMQLCLVLLENAETEEAKQTARDEIIRCGKILDRSLKGTIR